MADSQKERVEGMTQQRIIKLRRLLQESRCRLLHTEYDIAVPLREMTFVAVDGIHNMSVNADCIFFHPDKLIKWTQTETDFLLLHELLHIAMGHIDRPLYYRGERFHLACDIVVNAHLADIGWEYDRLPHLGNIYTETFFPKADGKTLTAQEAFSCIPFDPAAHTAGVRRIYMLDSDAFWDKKGEPSEYGTVVLSPQDEDPPDLAFVRPLLFGKRRLFEREFFSDDPAFQTSDSEPADAPDFEPLEEKRVPTDKQTDTHSESGGIEVWDKSEKALLQQLRSEKNRDGKTDRDSFSERMWQRPGIVRMNWRQLLNRFIQDEIFDYSFTPPDRRLQDSPFFLPDYSDRRETLHRVLFMVDTSASVQDGTLAEVYAEILGALEQFGGMLSGSLGFFDTQVYTPVPFSSARDIDRCIPRGGGATDFGCIFSYIRSHTETETPNCIVIFTDGQAPFPDESEADGIPVLWLLHHSDVIPPWGQVAAVTKKE